MTISALGDLSDPAAYHEVLDIRGRKPDELLGFLRMMIRIRVVELHLADMRREGHIGGPVHLSVGQEAVATGVSCHLGPRDKVFGGHRSHGHVLGLGSSVRGLFAEILGRDAGLARGMGGSMHLWDGPRGFLGSVPIVGGTVPLAVGAGLAAKMQEPGQVAVSYLGDGACEEGVVHESLNLASVLGVPVIFVVENNLFSSHMHIAQRQPFDSTARFAVAHGVRAEVVDGNDVVAVSAAAACLIDHARRGEGPGFLEAVTFRWLGHVDWRDDLDVGVSRSADDLALWRGRDPIRRLEDAMSAAKILSEEGVMELRAEVRAEVIDAWDEASSDPWPDQEALLGRVYAEGRNP
jgi:TPP-dependent pyruvate/acetoin dehydrogenase alpha subunit